MTGSSFISKLEPEPLDPVQSLPPASLLKKAELDLWEWDIQRDSVEVTDNQRSLFSFSTGHFKGSTRSFLNRIYAEDREEVAQQLRQASRGSDPAPLTFRMRTTDGSLRSLTLSGLLVKSSEGMPQRMIGLLHSIPSSETSEDRLRQQQAALLQWATSDAVTQGDTEAGFQLICRGAAKILSVERVSVWFFGDQQQHLQCTERYLLSQNSHTAGDLLSAEAFPQYFKALTKNKVIAVTDARVHRYTAVLSQRYLIPEGISSKLDVTISREGSPVGIISFEHTELPRQWKVDERGFAISIADMITMLLEISDRKDAETALSAQQQLLRDLMNNSSSLVYMTDLDGRYLLVNRQYEETHGVTQEQLLKKTPHALYPDELADQFIKNDLKVIQTGEVQTFEEQVLQSGTMRSYFSIKFPVRDAKGKTYAITSISTDVTERIQTEAALKESELRHRTLFESSLDAIMILDSNDHFIDCNPAASTLFADNLLVGRSVFTLFPGQDLINQNSSDQPQGSATTNKSENNLTAIDENPLLHALQISLQENKQFSLESHCQRLDGSEFDAEINLTPLTLSGERHRLLCIRDISARKQRDNMILNIAKGISASTGETFFRSLLEQLSRVLGANYAFVGQLHNNGSNDVTTLSVYKEGKEQPNFQYARMGTPCDKVLDENLCVFPKDVQITFPNDNMLKEMDIQAYVGAPLLDSDDIPLGVLVVMFTHPLEDTELHRHLLQIFAIRASAELQRKRHEAALVASEERYRAFINNSSEGIWRAEMIPPVDISQPTEIQIEHILSNYVILEANEAIAQMHCCTLEELYASSPEDFFGPRSIRELIREWIETNYQLANQEFQLEGPQKQQIWLSSSYSGVIENNQLMRIWGTRRDITQHKEYLSAIEYQAEHDALTHLPNRFWLNDRLQELIDNNRQSKQPLALMLLDLNHFKEVNDSLGHHTGDQLLRLIGPRLSSTLKKHNADIARLGGDEFAIIFNQIENPIAIEKTAEEVCQNLHQPFQLEGIKLEIHCSIGISLFPDHGDEPSALLRCADVAMYLAKNANAAYALYSSELDEHSPGRLALMSELGEAIRENQLLLHYQPQLDLNSKRISGFEALVRWQHPIQGMIPPGRFIHLAEMGDLIRPLTLWVLDAALSQWRRWKDMGHELNIAVNLSTRNLMDEACPEQVREMLSKHNVPPGCLELEITESALIADPARAMASLKEIHDLGVMLSIDDFGTGYSSLAYLKDLPIHQLKIDMSFVRNMAEDKRNEMIVNSTIHLAHNLGLSVVAEGVEDQTSLQMLNAMNCDLLQGYYISRPVPPQEIELLPDVLKNVK